ncbi:MAG: hypothetical protein KDK39_17155, partial [Leptospiraceae bacterium]|nr:hypothetical protein [Leptospiraceae bacterium]
MQNRRRIRRWFTIRVRITLLTLSIVFITTLLLSGTLFFQIRAVLLEKTFEICRNLSHYVANQAREELLLNEIFEMTRNAIDRIESEGQTSGLLNSYVVDVRYRIVAHSKQGLIGTTIPAHQQLWYANLQKLSMQETTLGPTRILRFSYPIFITVYQTGGLV